MTEAEILQSLFASIDTVVNLFSTFLAIVFAYVAGLYFFLNRAQAVRTPGVRSAKRRARR